MAETIKKALRKSQRYKTRRAALLDDDAVLTQESDSDALHQELDQQDQITSDTPSASSVLHRESASRLSQHLEDMDAPLPTFNDIYMTPSNRPTRATSPAEGNSPQMLNSREQEETEDVITKSLKKYKDAYEREHNKEAQRFADTEDEGDQTEGLTMMEKRINFEKNKEAKLDRELLERNSEMINPTGENPQNINGKTLSEKAGLEEEGNSEANSKECQEEEEMKKQETHINFAIHFYLENYNFQEIVLISISNWK